MRLRVARTAFHQKRGIEALKDFNLLPRFKGCLVHDCWGPYFVFTFLHALCNAHILRELIYVEEIAKQTWAAAFRELLLEIHRSAEIHRERRTKFSSKEKKAFSRRYDELIKKGHKANPLPRSSPDAPKKRGRPKKSKPQNLLARLELQSSSRRLSPTPSPLRTARAGFPASGSSLSKARCYPDPAFTSQGCRETRRAS